MGRKAVGPVCCVMHVKEPMLAPVFLDSRLEHPAGWICARYKTSVLLLLLLKDTSAATGQAGIGTHILTTPELESDTLERSTMTLHTSVFVKRIGLCLKCFI